MSPTHDDAATLERIRRLCLRHDDVEETELQGRPLFRVGASRRRFAIFNSDLAPPRKRWEAAGRSLHFLTDPTEQHALRHDDRFRPSPHHGDRGWLAVRLDRLQVVDWAEIEELLDSAHRQASRRRA